jgi:fused signal recognition particle receptor
MAFGFIKKVFSFGRKEIVEEKPEESAPLPVDPEALTPPAESLPAEPPNPAELAIEPPVGESEPAPQEIAREAAEPQRAPALKPELEPEPKPEITPAPLSVEPEIAPLPPEEATAEPVQPGPEPALPEIPPESADAASVPIPELPSLGLQEARATPPEPDEATPAPPTKPAKAEGRAEKVTVAKKVEQKVEPQQPAQPPQPRKSWFQRMREGLARSSRELSGNIAGVFTKRKLDEDTLQDLEDVLIRADLGVETALRVTDSLAASRYGKDVSDAEVRAVMAQEVEKVLAPVALPLELNLSHKPHVVLVVGVNGTGKTTTIGKLAAKLTEGGLSVMLAAGDTFRAAAIEQLKIWGERTNSPVVATKLGADAAGLAYDAFEKAREAGSDVLIIDTAGRLQNKAELMAELEKIVRVLGKLDPEAPHTVLQTVDATTGQNALNQVEIFRNVAGVNGLVMTKLDGTARGGILVAIAAKHKLPVYFIGVGEQVDDLEPFSANEFAKAIAGVE